MGDTEKKTKEDTDTGDDYDSELKREIGDLLQTHMDSARDDFKSCINYRMGEANTNYLSQQRQLAQERKEQACDFHAQNRAFELISRLLGFKWRAIYPMLFPLQKEQWEEHMDAIAAKSPNKFSLQAYKLLTLDKQEKGDDYDIESVLQALQLGGHPEIAEEALQTLLMGGADILEPVSKRKSHFDRNSRYAKDMVLELPYHNRPSDSMLPHVDMVQNPYQSALSNNMLVSIARSIGESWRELGEELKIPQENLDDFAAYNDFKTSAFQMLCMWREDSESSLRDKFYELIDCLNKIGRSELTESLKVDDCSVISNVQDTSDQQEEESGDCDHEAATEECRQDES